MTPLELLAVAVWIWDLPWLQILMVIGIWFAAWIFRIMFTSVTETYATVRRIERELRALDQVAVDGAQDQTAGRRQPAGRATMRLTTIAASVLLTVTIAAEAGEGDWSANRYLPGCRAFLRDPPRGGDGGNGQVCRLHRGRVGW